jgi:hypothetical protein
LFQVRSKQFVVVLADVRRRLGPGGRRAAEARRRRRLHHALAFEEGGARLTLCGWRAASPVLSTGPKQTSVFSSSAHQWALGWLRKMAASLAFSDGHADGSRWRWNSGSVMASFCSSSA